MGYVIMTFVTPVSDKMESDFFILRIFFYIDKFFWVIKNRNALYFFKYCISSTYNFPTAVTGASPSPTRRKAYK